MYLEFTLLNSLAYLPEANTLNSTVVDVQRLSENQNCV